MQLGLMQGPLSPFNTCKDSNWSAALSAQVPDIDVIIVPVSGGGMLSGIALAAKALRPGIVVLAAEPTGGPA